nr:Arm DNA-binding domain-containing protein [Bacilli bacterium]
MSKISVRKRGSVFQYRFEIASVEGKRKYISKSGFKTKKEAFDAGAKAYNEYANTGRTFKSSEISYSDYLDYWMKQHCEINLQYRTITAYQNIVKNHVKPKIGMYKLAQITTATLQE